LQYVKAKMNLEFIVRFLLAALAVYRVAMFTREDGPFGVFGHIRAALGKRTAGAKVGGLSWTLAEISNCPHCAGIWLAMLTAPAVICPNNVTDIILILLALAGLQSYLTGRGDE
jgi:hypothetical protein